jgi:hypothetical protein
MISGLVLKDRKGSVLSFTEAKQRPARLKSVSSDRAFMEGLQLQIAIFFATPVCISEKVSNAKRCTNYRRRHGQIHLEWFACVHILRKKNVTVLQ